jgi:hypothetical protein
MSCSGKDSFPLLCSCSGTIIGGLLEGPRRGEVASSDDAALPYPPSMLVR